MNIGVDAGCLGIKDERLKVGVFQLAFNLLRSLGKIDHKNNYWLYSFNPIPFAVLTQFGSKMKNILVGPKLGWNYLGLPFNLTRQKPDVFLGLSQSLPAFLPCPGVVVVHDLAFEIFPELYSGSYKQLRRITSQAVSRAIKIIAVSQTTKRDLTRLYHLSSKKITVIYEGYDQQFFKQETKPVPQKYFLFVGALKKSKNLPGLLKGFKYFLTKSNPAFRLRIVGGDLWLDPEIQKTIHNLEIADEVSFEGYVAFKKLVKFYQGASAFVSPAFYEGFGLTLVESMACGCPVICGRGGSQSEVVGRSGIIVNPNDEIEIGKAMIRATVDHRLRQKMINRGLKQAKLFSWQKFAKQTLNVLGKYEN